MLFWINSPTFRLLIITILLEINLPTYVYDCPECEHRFELRQSFQAESTAPCPLCETKSQRVILSVPVVFKGSGFYVNDYGKKGSTSKPASETTEDKTSSDKATNKDDNKSTDKSSKSSSDSTPKSSDSTETSTSKSNDK